MQLSAGPGGWAWGQEDDRVSVGSSRALPCSEARPSALGADPLVTPCSNPPSPSPPLGLSVHTFKMVIIVSAPKGEEELRTGPKWLKVEHFVGRMGGTLAHGTWFRLPVSLQQLGSNH